MDSPTMPPLVDQPRFIPPPHGAANGGQPGVYGGDTSLSQWPAPTNGAPNFSWPVSPTAPQPHSAASWTYGAYVPWVAQPAPPQPSPVAPLGTFTPGGTWSSASPAASWGPQTPAAYSPWIPPQQQQHQQQQQQQQGGTWITPNMAKSPYETSTAQPMASPWPGGTAGYTGYPEGWGGGSKPSTPKKPRSKKRNHSTPDDLSKRPPLYRSTSWGNNASKPGPMFPAENIPAYAKGDVIDERNLARRPLDWRPDYKPKLASFIPGLSKNRSDVTDYVDPIKRSLHPLLLFAHNAPPIYQNLLETPFHSSSVEFLNLHRAHNDIDLAQLACQPSAPLLRLFHPRLPWYIDVYQVHPNGVTVLDVLVQVHRQLHTQIHPRHFYNDDLTDMDRAEITRTFQARCSNDQGLVAKGVVQLDFLGDKIVFEGLLKGPKGHLEMKLSRERF